MTQDEIIRMAREAWIEEAKASGTIREDRFLERFAALVAEAERQRTIDILMELHRKANGQHNYYHFAANQIRGFSV